MTLRSSIATEVPHLRRFARALTGDPVYADDLVQDCVERALTRLHLFDKSRNLRVWLFTILRNIHVNEKRKQARHGVSVDIDDARGSELAQNPVQGDRQKPALKARFDNIVEEDIPGVIHEVLVKPTEKKHA